MEFPRKQSLTFVAAAAFIVALIFRGWDFVVSLMGLVLTAIIPLVLGSCIAYVVSIPTNFFARHILPNSDNKIIASLRKPLSLAISIILFLVGISLGSSVLVPALVDSLAMAQAHGKEFIELILSYPILAPIRDSVYDLLDSEFVQSLTSLDIAGLLQGGMGGTFASISNQIFSVVGSIMTGFFGLMFSFILLTDTTDVWTRCMEVAAVYLGPKRSERLALVFGVADASFHNFIVRQFIEASILGLVASITLYIAGYDYAPGVGMLMGICALVPIVGYPVGLFAGACLIVITNPWCALIYLVVVALSQMFEATFVLPYVGDPRTVLPPVWTTVGVTIGGGVAGFVGMLVAIPLASTVRQLVIIDSQRRQAAREQELLAQKVGSQVEQRS